MRTVWKYTLQPEKKSIKMPQGAKVLHVDEQYGQICLWAEVETEAPQEERFFDVFGTGHRQPYGTGVERNYIGSVKLDGGMFIFHIYERFGA